MRAGDSVTLVSPRGAVTPMGTTPRIKAYKIAAVFEIGMSEYDAAFVFMPLTEAQAYFNRNGDVTAIEVYTNNPDRIEQFRKLVTEAAKRPIFMIDWRQRNATFFNALQVERNVMFLILTLIVLVAALNIVSGLIMLVKDKGRDIAILRTMGATQGSIMRVFLITGAAIGVVGTWSASWSGSLVCLNIESIRQFLSWLTNTELFSPELYFLSRAAGRHRRRRDHGGGGDGAGAVAAGDALSVVARGAARSGRSAALRVSQPMAEQETPVVFLHQVERRYTRATRRWKSSKAPISRSGRGSRWRWWRRRAPANRRCCISPACSSMPTAARSISTARRPRTLRDAERTRIRRERDRLRLSGASSAAGILGDRERHAAADDPRPGRAEARKRAAELLSYLGLEERLTHRPAELSGGEQQRVAIARAVANAPRILLADEPTGNLDPKTSDHVFRALSQLVRASGLTVVLATHNMDIAARMDRRVTIRDGLIVELP